MVSTYCLVCVLTKYTYREKLRIIKHHSAVKNKCILDLHTQWWKYIVSSIYIKNIVIKIPRLFPDFEKSQIPWLFPDWKNVFQFSPISRSWRHPANNDHFRGVVFLSLRYVTGPHVPLWFPLFSTRPCRWGTHTDSRARSAVWWLGASGPHCSVCSVCPANT